MTNFYLNHLQIRAARNVLDLGVRELGSLVGVSRTIIYRLENNIIQLKIINQGDRLNNILIWFFNKQNIIFNDEYSIKYNIEPSIAPTLQKTLITRFQFKASRVILKQDRMTLSKSLNINVGVLDRCEKVQNNCFINPKNTDIVYEIKKLFEQRGIYFPNQQSIIFKKLVDESMSI